jgi:hypothetical protein
VPWYQCLGAHAAIQAGFVWFVTGSGVLALFEFLSHAWTDYKKSDGQFGYNTDQFLHLFHKLAWALILVYTPLFR